MKTAIDAMQLEHADITVKSVEESVRLLATAFPQARIRGEGSRQGDPDSGRWVHFGDDSSYIAPQQNARHIGRR